MKIVPLLADETDRLVALKRYHILDTKPEPDFDNITVLASHLCETPISLISLVDEKREWFKAKVGLTINQISRDISFGNHAILQIEPFIVPDALQDERFVNNPLVSGYPPVRFYASIPLITADGYNVGTLSVIDDKPRQLTNIQLNSLQTLARQVIALLEMRLYNNKLTFAYQQLEKLTTKHQEDLALAGNIQQALLPSPRQDWQHLRIRCLTRPADEVSGDFYIYHRVDVGHFLIALGDVSGSGMAAALLMATSLTYLESIITFTLPPDQILFYLDQALARYNHSIQQNCAMCLVEIKHHDIEVVNAGGVPPYIKRQSGELEILDNVGFPLGIGLGRRTGYEPTRHTLHSGDTLIVVSDGVIEANNAYGDMLGFDAWEQILQALPADDIDQMFINLDEMMSNCIEFNNPHDDVTIIIVQLI